MLVVVNVVLNELLVVLVGLSSYIFAANVPSSNGLFDLNVIEQLLLEVTLLTV